MGILYKTRIRIAQKGIKTVLGGDIGLVQSDYASGQQKNTNSSGQVFTGETRTAPGVNRAAVSTAPLAGQKIATRTGQHPVASPVNALTGDAASLANVKMRQMNLQKAGLYDGEIDGIWGDKSEGAWQTHIRSSPELMKFWKVK